MTILTNAEEKNDIRKSGEIIKYVFSWLEDNLREGMTTLDVDREVENIIREKGGTPAFKGYKGFPATICASVNEVIVHGIPSEDVVLAEGDIVGIDVGVKRNGYFTDAARTYAVGRISPEAQKLIDTARESLAEGIKQALSGNRICDISRAIQKVAWDNGFKEVRAFVGHGTGKHLHEAPEVPNWVAKDKGPVLKDGLVLAIEPMINAGTRDVRMMDDGWTAKTADNSFSAHFEDTIIVGNEKAEIVT